MSEYAKIWKNRDYSKIELLSASFNKFSYAKHWHDEFAIGLIQKGAEGLDFNGSKISIPANNIVAINPGEVHTGFSASNIGWTYRMFYFDVSLIKEILQDRNIYNLSSFVNLSIHDPKLFNKFLSLHIALEEEHFKLKKDSLIVESITEIFSTYTSSKFDKTKTHKDFRINTLIREYIIDNFSQNISLDELSLLFKRDKYQLIRNFKSQFNISPHQFHNFLKIQKSKILLEKGFDISTIALDCGFFDQSHYSRNFKNIFGLSPGSYKRLSKLN